MLFRSTKVTADKLQSAWKKAGSPTDSAAIEQILTQAGVNPQVISTVFKTNNIPVSQSTTAAQEMPAVMTPNREQPATSQQSASTRLPDVSKLTPEQKQKLIKIIDQRLAELG